MTVSEETWFAIRVTGKPEASDAIESAFAVLEAQGIETDQLGKQRRDEVSVVGYFDEPVPGDRVRMKVTEALSAFNLPSESVFEIREQEIENRDWLSEWKKHWRAVRSGPFLVAPPWEDVEETDARLIRIEPSMAFGTGTHETTRLCLEAIGRYYEPGMSFLDVGTGTGILSIAAALLTDSTTQIRACDVDRDSVALARKNAVSNGVGFVDFEVGTLSPGVESYHFVCANMTIDIIGPMVQELVDTTRKTLVLSGILAEQEELARKMLAGIGEFDTETTKMGEWIALIIRK